jgi:hypothetical protein
MEKRACWATVALAATIAMVATVAVAIWVIASPLGGGARWGASGSLGARGTLLTLLLRLDLLGRSIDVQGLLACVGCDRPLGWRFLVPVVGPLGADELEKLLPETLMSSSRVNQAVDAALEGNVGLAVANVSHHLSESTRQVDQGRVAGRQGMIVMPCDDSADDVLLA